jgi:hypothetical protein
VLQAIHMLLFFPLFVVVVAVDARWITRSLEIQFPHLLMDERVATTRASAPAASPTAVVAPAPPREGRPAPATALDYLEKIFHIPLWVRSMNSTTSVTFVRGLTKDTVRVILPEAAPRDDEPRRPREEGSSSATPAAASTRGTPTATLGAATDGADAASQESDKNGESILQSLVAMDEGDGAFTGPSMVATLRDLAPTVRRYSFEGPAATP